MKTAIKTFVFGNSSKKFLNLAFVLMLCFAQPACTGNALLGFLGSAAGSVLTGGTILSDPQNGGATGTTGTSGTSGTGGSSTTGSTGSSGSSEASSGGSGTSGAGGVSSATDESGLDGDEDVDSDSDAEDDSNVLPQASIPLPPGLQASSISVADDNGISTSQGSLGLDAAGMSLVITTGSVSAKHEFRWRDLLGSVTQAFADGACPEDMEYAACVTINDDGSFKAHFENSDEAAEVSFYIYDPATGEISEPATDTVNQNLAHVANDILSITSDGANVLYGLSNEGKFVQLEYDQDAHRIRTLGNSDDDYSSLQVLGAEQIVYNQDANKMVVLNNQAVLQEYEVDVAGGVATPTANSSMTFCNPDLGCNAQDMKLRSNASGTRIFYGALYDDLALSEAGNVNELYSNDVNQFIFAPRTTLFTVGEDTYSSSFKEIKTFDFYTEQYDFDVIVVIAENADGYTRLFSKFRSEDLGEMPLIQTTLESKYTDFFDIIAIDQQDSDDLADGRGAFLSNIGLTFFDYDAVNYEDGASFVMGPDIEIPNAVAMAVNADKTEAYVISSGSGLIATDDTITVIDLIGETLKTDVGDNGVVQLTQFMPDKNVVDLSPSTVTYFTQDGAEFVIVTLNNGDHAFKDSAIIIEIGAEE